MIKNAKLTIIQIIAFCLLLCPEVSCHKDVRAFMLITYFDLMNYAHDHEGWLPKSDKGPFDALQKLYPDYCDGPELVGLSGDRDALLRALKNGEPLNAKLTSWVYVQGLRDTDDASLAVLWESKSGLSSDGKNYHANGHAVIFLNATRKQIPESDWANFLEQQARLRQLVFANRSLKANQQPQTP